MNTLGTQAAIPTAATVLLLRETDAGLQVLMTKRAAGLSFMAGLWVFPGGRMEDSDRSAAIAARTASSRLDDVHRRMLALDGQPIQRETAVALHVAACRETFEESGVLLARARLEAAAFDEGQAARLAAHRVSQATATAFEQLLETEDLLLDLDRLVYWSHWITPSLEKKRFDTRFFAVQVPAGQVASVDRSELTQHAWFTEREIREHLRSGEIKVAPPTLATLQDLWRSHAAHGGLEPMLAAEKSRDVPPILPKMHARDDGAFEIVLPWDADYAGFPGEGCAVAECYPDYLLALPSRRTFKR
ncbi:MAG TPA: NUDIX domain-containing protein [Steroidobacteraceae bacterium]